jgi:coenzyme F420 hydrogenase subunit beta
MPQEYRQRMAFPDGDLEVKRVMVLAKQKATAAEATIAQGGQKDLEVNVLAARRCTGCGACVNLCPYLAIYRDRTVTLHPCDLSRGRCYAYCPQTPVDRESLQNEWTEAADGTSDLGALKGFYLTRAADERIRATAQHGGTVTALVALALREGIIDAAVVADKGGDLLPRAKTVTHPEAVLAVGGSRFVVSPAVAEFNRAVQQGDHSRIGVVATPCQALALAKIRTQPIADATDGSGKLGLVVGLFCGWALDWQKLTALLSCKVDLAKVTGMDIPPSRYQRLEVYTAAGTLSVPLAEVTPCVREACQDCPDMTAEFSDLSVGSARLPEGWEAARGWNQVIVRTVRGAELLELARRRGVLEFRTVPPENLEKLKTAALGKRRAAAQAKRKVVGIGL